MYQALKISKSRYWVLVALLPAILLGVPGGGYACEEGVMEREDDFVFSELINPIIAWFDEAPLTDGEPTCEEHVEKELLKCINKKRGAKIECNAGPPKTYVYFDGIDPGIYLCPPRKYPPHKDCTDLTGGEPTDYPQGVICQVCPEAKSKTAVCVKRTPRTIGGNYKRGGF